MVFLTGLKTSSGHILGLFIMMPALALFFDHLFLPSKSYEMMSGDKKLEIMPLVAARSDWR